MKSRARPMACAMPERAALVAVRQVEPEVPAVAQQLDDVADALAADDDHHLADAHARQRVERVVDHRPVVDRQQVLVGDDREREQPGRRPAGKHEAFHRGEPSRGNRLAERSGCRRRCRRRRRGAIRSGRPRPARRTRSTAGLSGMPARSARRWWRSASARAARSAPWVVAQLERDAALERLDVAEMRLRLDEAGSLARDHRVPRPRSRRSAGRPRARAERRARTASRRGPGRADRSPRGRRGTVRRQTERRDSEMARSPDSRVTRQPMPSVVGTSPARRRSLADAAGECSRSMPSREPPGARRVRQPSRLDARPCPTAADRSECGRCACRPRLHR